jgi:TRAP-type transport system small permease protein
MIVRLLDHILAWADAAARVVVIACMGVMVVVVSAQVFMRYVLNSSIDWADEASRLAFVWTIFLAIPLGIREGAHVGIDILVERFPARLRTVLSHALALIAALMMAVLFVTSVSVAGQTWSERLGAINMTSSSFFVAVIIGAGHAFLHLLRLGIDPHHPGLRSAPVDALQ